MAFLDYTFLNNSLQSWLTALGVTVLALTLFWITKRVILARFNNLTRRTTTDIDDFIAAIVDKTSLFLLMLLALYVGARPLTIPPNIEQWIGTAAFAIFLLQVGIWGNAAVKQWVIRYQQEHLDTKAEQVTLLRAGSFVVRLILYSLLLLLALDNIPGVEVTAMIASLGIGGVAVALAVQNILGDLFASLSIAFDKPFVIGDFVIVGDFMGTVEQIGLKTTRLRSISGEKLILANSDLVNSRIRNYQDMQERRVVFTVGITYDTPIEKVRQIPQWVQEYIEAQSDTRFDRAHFFKFGDFSLDFEIVYYVLSADYNLYMDTQQAINLALMERFADEGVEFAYPTRTIQMAAGTEDLKEQVSTTGANNHN